MSTWVCLFLGRGSERAIVRISDLQRRPGRLCRETLCLELGPVRRGRGSNKSFTRQNSLWWVITTKKAWYLFKGALRLPCPSWFRSHTDTYWCGSMKLFTNFCCDRRVFALRPMFILGLWHVATFSSVQVGKLFGHFIFPLDSLVASLQTMLLTQAPLLCCVCGLYIVYVVILFDLLVLFRCTWLFMLSKAPWALKALYKANMLLL